MKILKNSRQIPSVEKYTANKDYSDLLYGYLQEKSFLDVDKNRYIAKKDIVFSKIAQDFSVENKDGEKRHCSRQTVSKYFKKLVKMGLLELTEDGKYYQLTYLDKSLGALVPLETLRVINNVLKPKCISIYVYLLKRYFANNEKSFPVTLSQLKTFVGISTKTRSNDDIINDILWALKKLGLIDYKLVQVEQEKTNIIITKVENEIKKG